MSSTGGNFEPYSRKRFDHDIDHGAPSLVGNEVGEAMGFVTADVELLRAC